MINKLTDFTKFGDLFFASEENLPRNSQYGKSYHNLESSAKCPRCSNSGELIESGPVRCLYRCEKCGIFSKITKKQGSDGKPIECRLDCGDCGRFQRWVSQREFDRKMGKQGGRGNA